MILTDSQILKEIREGNIVIDPFNKKSLGANSYDVHLSKYLSIYIDNILDSKKHNKVKMLEIPKNGLVLHPDVLYLGCTVEYTESHRHVPLLDGKSSTGRLGISIHTTAGTGDIGFCNNWTLQLTTAHRVRVYAGMPIGQLVYFEPKGKVTTKYKDKKDAKYVKKSAKPIESMMWKNGF